MSKVTLVYKGLSEKDRKRRKASFEKRLNCFPETFRNEYDFLKKDSAQDRVRKMALRKAYQEKRRAEFEAEIETLDAVKEVGWVVFPKDQPVTVNLDDPDVDAVGILRKVKVGSLHQVTETPQPKAEEKPQAKAKPKPNPASRLAAIPPPD
jgi:hypothetical protein